MQSRVPLGPGKFHLVVLAPKGFELGTTLS